ncbi:MAG: monovalent cation:proton antiporter-2 (CPA2) family protein [Pseudomonadota bacterium]
MPGLAEALAILTVAITLVAISSRLGLGAVLGYLLAGILVGPFALRLVPDPDKVLHVAEFGVVLLLFVIGLELRPARLWAMRTTILRVGVSQIIVSAILLTAFASLFTGTLNTAALIGIVLALSSTAFALQLIAERGELSARWGRTAFGILLSQDLAVVPLLAILPLLGAEAGTDGISVLKLLESFAILIGVALGGRYLLRGVLRVAARSNVREILTASALFVVLGASLLLEEAGLSMALGAFLAGVLLADSEFRHQLEAEIEPFKGLLLGLFFLAVGMTLNLSLLVSSPLTLLSIVIGLVAIKFVVLFGLGKVNKLDTRDSIKLGLALSQGGEFAFVLFGVAILSGSISGEDAALFTLAVSLSMATTPLLFFCFDLLSRNAVPAQEEFDDIHDEEPPVIILGFGRFGQIVSRILSARRIPFVALDASHHQVDFVKQYGNDIYYGDGTRLDLLESAGTGSAKVLVLAIDDVEASVQAATIVQQHFPNVTVVARARNRKHAHRLMDVGVTIIQRETVLSAADIAIRTLELLGLSHAEATATAHAFLELDEKRLVHDHPFHHEEDTLKSTAKAAAKELEDMFERDAKELGNDLGRAAG